MSLWKLLVALFFFSALSYAIPVSRTTSPAILKISTHSHDAEPDQPTPILSTRGPVTNSVVLIQPLITSSSSSAVEEEPVKGETSTVSFKSALQGDAGRKVKMEEEPVLLTDDDSEGIVNIFGRTVVELVDSYPHLIRYLHQQLVAREKEEKRQKLLDLSLNFRPPGNIARWAAGCVTTVLSLLLIATLHTHLWSRTQRPENLMPGVFSAETGAPSSFTVKDILQSKLRGIQSSLKSQFKRKAGIKESESLPLITEEEPMIEGRGGGGVAIHKARGFRQKGDRESML